MSPETMGCYETGVARTQKTCHHQLYQTLAHSTHMKTFVHPLLLLLAQATEKELVQTIEYLKTGS